MSKWFVICTFSDTGEYEVHFDGDHESASTYFRKKLSKEQDARNVTDSQFEIWVDQHYQNDFQPGLAYTVKLTDKLPAGFH